MQGPRIGLSSKKGVSIPAIGILVLFVLARGILPGEPESVPSFPELEGWKLVFEDQFDGPKLDYEKWTPKDPWGVERNGELQGYSRQNFIQENGVLTIVAEKTPAFYDGKRREYRSGMMTTTRKFSQRYGRFAIRCRIPRGQGLWPAFWMLPEPPSWPPEIDVFEILGQEPDRAYLSHHWLDERIEEDPLQSQTGEYRGPDFSESFHVFAVDWEPGRIRWFIDGVLRHEDRTRVPEVPMFLLVNLAVGGWADDPDENTKFPARFEIDWVRAWEKSPE